MTNLFDTGLRLFLVIVFVTWLLWLVNMVGDLLIPRPERAGAPPEVPLTPIYKSQEQDNE